MYLHGQYWGKKQHISRLGLEFDIENIRTICCSWMCLKHKTSKSLKTKPRGIWDVRLVILSFCTQCSVYFQALYPAFWLYKKKSVCGEALQQSKVLGECGYIQTPWSGKPFINLREWNTVYTLASIGWFLQKNISPDGKSTEKTWERNIKEKPL